MGKKILLADDSITIQKVIELTFSDEDFDVVTVGNGRLALERLADVRPDIVLCDIVMPEKDGYEVCEQIKSSPAWSHVPVLLLTGAFEPFDQDRAARAGYDGSLAKPFEPETLIAKVKELLARAPKAPAAPVGPVAAPPARPVAAPPAAAPAVPSFMVPPPTSSGPVVISRAVPPPVPAPPAGPASAFIPEEPFVAGEPEFAPGAPGTPGLADVERQSLAMPSERGTAAFPPPEDDASTVMFRSTELPWATARGGPASVTAPVPQASRPTPVAPPAFEPEPEPQAPEPEVVEEEAPAFEAVLEEDLEFGDVGYEPEPETGSAPAHEPVFAPATAAPPLASGPAPESTTGAFAALVRDQFVMPPQEPPAETLHAQPAPELKPETVRVERDAAGRPPVTPLPPEAAAELEPEEEGVEALESFAPEVTEPARYPTAAEATFEDEDLSAVEPEPAFPVPAPLPTPVVSLPIARTFAPPVPVAPAAAAAPAPPVAPPVAPAPSAATSFADVAPAEHAEAASQAAGVAVPVDMVEKIAQRVIAQISEKAVREIAWEVIPDLAEAIIKQEIARLKAELAKL